MIVSSSLASAGAKIFVTKQVPDPLPEADFKDVENYYQLLSDAKTDNKQVLVVMRDEYGHLGFGAGKIDKIEFESEKRVPAIKASFLKSENKSKDELRDELKKVSNRALLAFSDVFIKNGLLSPQDVAKLLFDKAIRLSDFSYGPFHDGVMVMMSFSEDDLIEHEKQKSIQMDSWVTTWRKPGVIMHEQKP